MLDCSFVGGVHLDRIVAAEPHRGELLVRKMLDHLQQTRIGAEEILPEVCAAFDEIFLILAVGDLAHAVDQQAVAVARMRLIPIAPQMTLMTFHPRRGKSLPVPG